MNYLIVFFWSIRTFLRYLKRILSSVTAVSLYRHQLIYAFEFCISAIMLFLTYLMLSGSSFLPPPEDYFDPPITGSQRIELMTVMRDFHGLMSRHNIDYLLGSGTLLGSYRHHGLIPWDDDADVFAFEEDQEKIETALSTDLPKSMRHYKLFKGDTTSPMWKLYDSRSAWWYYHFSFRWPFVDILFLKTINSTHVYHDDWQQPIHVDQIFPLTLRLYEDMWLPTPCNIEHMLSFLNVNDCQNRGFSHLAGFSLPLWRQHRIVCSRLKHLHPFVSRTTEHFSNGSSLSHERLMIGDRVLHSVSVKVPRCGRRTSVKYRQHSHQDENSRVEG